MEIIKIAAIGLVAVVLAMIMRTQKPEFATLLIVGTGVLISFFMIGKLQVVIDAVAGMQKMVKVDVGYVAILLKMIGITYIAEFACNLCKDAGFHSLSGQIEMFAKLAILSISMPIVMGLMETVSAFLGQGGM